MSADAGIEEHCLSSALLPLSRRTPQFPPLPISDAAACTRCDTALAAHAEDRDRTAPTGCCLRPPIAIGRRRGSKMARDLTEPTREHACGSQDRRLISHSDPTYCKRRATGPCARRQNPVHPTRRSRTAPSPARSPHSESPPSGMDRDLLLYAVASHSRSLGTPPCRRRTPAR